MVIWSPMATYKNAESQIDGPRDHIKHKHPIIKKARGQLERMEWRMQI